MKKRVFEVMSRVFGVPLEQINEESSPDYIESWDSLKHMNLVLALEEEFNIQFTDEQIAELMSGELILNALRENGSKDDE